VIRVAIVDDYEPVRTLMRALIGIEEDLELVGEAADGIEALELIERVEPDVVLLDLAMPRLDGLAVLTKLSSNGVRPRVVVYSCNSEIESVLAAGRLGAAEYLVKGARPDAVIESLRRAAAVPVAR
jgi:DNA-binding NarL/FixJ family response regulator